jgi:hypothetical protein
VAIDLEIEEFAARGFGKNEAEALPVGGTAQEVSGGVVDLVDVVGEGVNNGGVEDEAVVFVFGVLDCSEEGVSVAVDEDIEGVKVGVTLVAEGEGDDEDGGEKLDGEDGGDEMRGDGAGIEGELHWWVRLLMVEGIGARVVEIGGIGGGILRLGGEAVSAAAEGFDNGIGRGDGGVEFAAEVGDVGLDDVGVVFPVEIVEVL